MTNTISGYVKDGQVIVDGQPFPLPEGAVVEIQVLVDGRMEFTPEEREEIDGWNRLSDQAMELVDRLIEQETPDEPR